MRGKMKAWIFYEPLKMEYEEVDIPQLAPDEVLVKIKACGICGSDIAYYWGNSSLETENGKGPLILGHEMSGEIVELGELPNQLGIFEIGDRVAIDPVQYCNACEVCKKGEVNLCENKTVLGVCDGLRGTYKRGVPWYWSGIIMSRDQVAAETVALAAINEKRLLEGETALDMPPYVTRADTVHGLGNARREKILVKTTVM